MEKEFIPYEQALALKQLEFDEPCFGWFDVIDFELFIEENEYSESNKDIVVLAPLYQQAFRWFREKYGYFPSFDFQHGDSKDNKGYFFCIINIDNEDFFFPEDFAYDFSKITYKCKVWICLKENDYKEPEFYNFETHEEALEIGLQEALKLIEI